MSIEAFFFFRFGGIFIWRDLSYAGGFIETVDTFSVLAATGY